MNKDEIKKALECCSENTMNNCKNCPYYYIFNCNDTLCKDALNLITEQEEEIERLKAENEELTKVVSSKVYDLIDNTKEIADAREAWEQQAKIEAVKDFAEKLKEKYSIYDDRHVLYRIIDELLKEYEK